MNCFYIFKRKLKGKGEAKSAPELRGKSKLEDSTRKRITRSLPSPRSIPELYQEKEPNLRDFSYQELRDATKDFNRSLKIGEGGFGSVYKGTILNRVNGQSGNPTVVAIKRHNKQGMQVIYRDFKSSSVLLDKNFNAKLSDFGLAREGPKDDWSHVSTASFVWYAYAAPEYLGTGKFYVASDAWTFGVVLYEIITGRRTLERSRPTAEQKLLTWVKQFPPDSKRFSVIIDSRLRNSEYPIGSARKVASLADLCLNKIPEERPTMCRVVETLKEVIHELGESSGNGSTSKKRSNKV